MSKSYPNVEYAVPRAQERYERQLALLSVAAKISRQGMRFDDELAVIRLREAAWRQAYCTWKFLEVTGLPEAALGEAGTGATKAVRKYFWETLGAPQLMHHKRTKAPQFNTPLLLEYMSKLPVEAGGEASLLLVGMRAASKTQQFLRTYRAFAEAGNGKVFGGFNSLGTKGDRWSSSKRLEHAGGEWKLNLQNIPGKGFTVKRKGLDALVLADPLRDLFLPDEGCTWIKFDYDAQEARLLAYVSKAQKLREWIAGKRDMHILNALGIFTELVEAGILHDGTKKGDSDDVDKARDAAKTAIYAFSYQYAENAATATYIDTYKAWKKWDPKMELKYVNKCAGRLFALHPEIPAMQKFIRSGIDERGYVEHPISGGRLYLPSENRGYNIGINYLMQSGGGHVFNLGLLKIAPQMRWGLGETAILSLVHDEINAQAPTSEVPAVVAFIREAMEAPFELYGERVNLPAEASTGPHWGALEKYKAPAAA